ncbi:MAG TPA: hypothetical protein VF885_14825 [Arthrobacter sp.]
MSIAVRAVAGGLVAGFTLALALCMAASALAVMTGTTVAVPGFFSARGTLGSGSFAVVFTPDWGAVALVVLGAVISAVMAGRRSARRSARM